MLSIDADGLAEIAPRVENATVGDSLRSVIFDISKI
jgi:hypothetical protein